MVTAFSIIQSRSTKSKYKSSNRMKTSVHRGGHDFLPQHPLYVSHVGENESWEGKAGFMGKRKYRVIQIKIRYFKQLYL